MKINQNIEKTILQYLQDYLVSNKSATVKELIENYSAIPTITESEIRQVIIDAANKGFLNISNLSGGSRDLATVFLVESIPSDKKIQGVIVVISKPRLRELGLVNIQQRNDQIDTIDCFRTLIDSSMEIIRISSPFMQSDVIDDDAFSDLINCMSNALIRNVKVRILTRDLKTRGEREIAWILNLAKHLKKENNVSIVDYHLLAESGKILSSTHAKLIISDDKLAYVGSAELRKNSLIANFEVGCLLSGSQVTGLCEIFDTMYSKGTVWK
jgi:phosphatidylserine/phosphatidylglycerophosphate/cardiolipin synthase-like enzyme